MTEIPHSEVVSDHMPFFFFFFHLTLWLFQNYQKKIQDKMLNPVQVTMQSCELVIQYNLVSQTIKVQRIKI